MPTDIDQDYYEYYQVKLNWKKDTEEDMKPDHIFFGCGFKL